VRLNRWDDLPFHQTAEPLGQPHTSDTHFNDGYYFSFYKPGIHVFMGLRLSPNTNVMDGYAGVVVHSRGEQRNQRLSRALRPHFDVLELGPLSVEILEPMRRQRIALTNSDIGLNFDVTIVATGDPHVEHGHRQYRYGKLLNDLIRYTQTGRASGLMRIDDDQILVDGWHACRDHSWGLRSTMGPYIPIKGIPGTDDAEPDRRAIRIWIPFEVDGMSGFFHTHEDATGATLDFEGRIDPAKGDPILLASCEHEFEYHPGTRRLKGGAFTLIDHDGNRRTFTFTSVCYPAHPQGFGYTRGWNDGGGLGVWRGEAYTEHERFKVDDNLHKAAPERIPADRRLGGTEFVCDLTGPGGEKGMAHVEHMIYGAYEPSGFE
jgi:hypothetical protein